MLHYNYGTNLSTLRSTVDNAEQMVRVGINYHFARRHLHPRDAAGAASAAAAD
jgi:hypothetical protein